MCLRVLPYYSYSTRYVVVQANDRADHIHPHAHTQAPLVHASHASMRSILDPLVQIRHAMPYQGAASMDPSNICLFLARSFAFA